MKNQTTIKEVLKALRRYNTATGCFTVEIYDDESGYINDGNGSIWETFNDLTDCLGILKAMNRKERIDAKSRRTKTFIL